MSKNLFISESCGESKRDIFKKYWEVALPASVEGVFLNLILLADLIMVGKLGIAQAAAIGIVSQPKMIVQMIGKSLGVGVTAVVSRRKGEKDSIGLNDCIKQSFVLTTLIYVFIVFLALRYSKTILLFMGANEEYIGYALDYFNLLIIALFFKALSSILNSVHVGLGKTSINLQASVIGNITNVVLNYTLIFGHFGFPRLEIRGAAIATIIGEFVIFIVLFLSLLFKSKDEGVDLFRGKSAKPESKTLKPVMEIGGNAFFEQIFQRIGLIIFAKLIAELGTESVGIHHYCILIWDLYFYFGLGMGAASSSFAGINLGKKRKDLAMKYVKVAQKSGLALSLFVSLLFILLKRQIFSQLLQEKEYISLGANVLLIISILIIPQTQSQILAGTLRGAGDNRFIAVYSLFVSAIFRSIVAYILAFVFKLGLYGIWGAFFVDELLKMFLTKYRINKGIWLEKIV